MMPRVRLLLLIAGFGIACSNATQARINHGLELDSGYLIPDLIPAELVSDKLPGELAPGVIPFKLEGSRGAERHARGMDLKGMPGLISPDGIHWTKLAKPLIPDDLNTDWGHSVFWNPQDRKYHAYLRYWEGGDESHKVHSGYRSLRHMSSDDFYNGSPWTPIRYDNPPNDHMQIYMNNIRPYERAPHILIGPVKRFTPERKKHPGHPYPGLSDGGLMTSRDGLHFKFWQEAFNRPGPDPKKWIQRNLVPVNGILQSSPEELSLYWIEHYYSHFPEVEPGVEGCRMRRGTIRTDGFVSMQAPYAGGEFVTKPFLFEGRELVINYATSAMGSVRVEMQEEGGGPIEGFRREQCPDIFGDEIEHVVSWEDGADIKRLEGRPIRLRFVLKDADLYSFRFRPEQLRLREGFLKVDPWRAAKTVVLLASAPWLFRVALQ